MGRYQDQITDEHLHPVANAEIWVFYASGPNLEQQAALTDDDGAEFVQPLLSDTDGIFYFNAADGLYENHVYYGAQLRYVQQCSIGEAIGAVADGAYGDITVSGGGADWQINPDSVGDAELRNSAGLSVIGRSASNPGDPADIVSAADGHVLRQSEAALGFGQVATAGIADGAITAAKLAPGAVPPDGVTSFNTRVGAVTLLGADVTGALGYTPANIVHTHPTSDITGLDAALAAKADDSDLANYIPLTQKGAANGVAPLDGTSKVPAAYLPSYVDDVVEYANLAAFPATGETGKIYVAIDTGKTYRWTGSAYVEISSSSGAAWGTITGTLSNQTDLQTALNAKANLAGGNAFTGDQSVTGKVSAVGVNANWNGAASQTARNPGVYVFSNAAYGMELGFAGGSYAVRLFTDFGTKVTIGCVSSIHTLQSDFVDWATFSGTGLAVTGTITANGSAVATVSQLANYLPLTGGTLTGSLQVNGNLTLAPDKYLLTSDGKARAYFTTNGANWYYTAGTEAGAQHFWQSSTNATVMKLNAAGDLTVTGDVIVPDEAYSSGWNGSLEVPTKNAVFDKIEAVTAGGGGVTTFNTRSGAVTLTAADVTAAMPAFTGDVTSPAGSTVNTIPAGKVTLAMQANMATASLVYRKAAGAGPPEVQTLATLKTDLGLTGTNSGDQATITGNAGTATALQTPRDFSIAGGGITAAAVAFNGTANVVLSASVDAGHITLARMANMATASVIYRKTAGNGAPEVQTLATLKTDLGITGTNSGDQTSIVGITGTIAQFNTACTDADFATVASLANYLPLTGGTLTGALTVNSTISATGLATASGLNIAPAAGNAFLSMTPGGASLYSILLLKGNGGSQALGLDITAGQGSAYLNADNFVFRNAAQSGTYATINATGLAVIGTITTGGNTVATVSQLANYLPLTGGALSGALTSTGKITGAGLQTSIGTVTRADGEAIFYSVAGSPTGFYSIGNGGYLWNNAANTGQTMTLDNAGNLTVTGKVSAVGVNANKDSTASSTARNPGVYSFNNGSVTNGMEFGSDGLQFGTRIFAHHGNAVWICGVEAGATLQSDFTAWAKFLSTGVAVTGTITATGDILIAGRAQFQTPNIATTGAIQVRGNATSGYGYLQATDPPATGQWSFLRWAASGQLYHSGAFTAAGGVSLLSDERDMVNVRPFKGALGIAKRLRGVRYKQDGQQRFGIIGQELKIILPELVSTVRNDADDDDLLAVDYGRLSAVLIEAVKELTAKVERLEAAVEN